MKLCSLYHTSKLTRTLTLSSQQLQVDLTVDIGQKISNRLSTPGGHLDKDMSHYDEAQKMVLKELVPFYAGLVCCYL